MFVAMNRFVVPAENQGAFERLWRERDSRLATVKGARSFMLLKGEWLADGSARTFISHSTWDSEVDFHAWLKSAAFRHAHAQAGETRTLHDGPPVFEAYDVVLAETFG